MFILAMNKWLESSVTEKFWLTPIWLRLSDYECLYAIVCMPEIWLNSAHLWVGWLQWRSHVSALLLPSQFFLKTHTHSLISLLSQTHCTTKISTNTSSAISQTLCPPFWSPSPHSKSSCRMVKSKEKFRRRG